MSDNKKEQERAELHKTIWGIEIVAREDVIRKDIPKIIEDIEGKQ